MVGSVDSVVAEPSTLSRMFLSLVLSTIVESRVNVADGSKPSTTCLTAVTSQLKLVGSGESFTVACSFSDGEAFMPYTKWCL